jgi:hypothetical protein
LPQLQSACRVTDGSDGARVGLPVEREILGGQAAFNKFVATLQRRLIASMLGPFNTTVQLHCRGVKRSNVKSLLHFSDAYARTAAGLSPFDAAPGRMKRTPPASPEISRNLAQARVTAHGEHPTWPAMFADAQAAGRWPLQRDRDRDNRESRTFRRGHVFVDREHDLQMVKRGLPTTVWRKVDRLD